ncbi:uncharacterized protein LOC131231792 [Magnolia sinica]|uniref:uncharacterized protein LOC131231792 n=1 Tax=Magnolia sinica TaxID=86752 RepID=UPI002659E8BB|nr:uncharacterized protein LOC131231792 [Magnolia sinica]
MEDRDPPWNRVPSRKNRRPFAPFSIFAANLSFDTSSNDLRRIFGRYGKLTNVYIPWNRHLNRSRGFAFIHFVYEQEAFNAIKCLHDRRIDGRVVHIEWAKNQSKVPFSSPKANPDPILAPITRKQTPDALQIIPNPLDLDPISGAATSQSELVPALDLTAAAPCSPPQNTQGVSKRQQPSFSTNTDTPATQLLQDLTAPKSPSSKVNRIRRTQASRIKAGTNLRSNGTADYAS